MKKLLIICLALGFFACSPNEKSTPKNNTQQEQTLAEEITTLLDADKYAKALEVLHALEDTDESRKLREIIHLNYGLFLEYRDANVSNMRDKMNSALRQYIEVLKINPDNEKATSEIEQILDIYSSFPDRSPDADVLEALKQLGFNV